MPGILTREGVSKGLAPTIEVLSLGKKNRRKEPSDFLPYLPHFKRFFPTLPEKVAEMELKVLAIPLTAVDCITKTTVKVGRDSAFFACMLKHTARLMLTSW